MKNKLENELERFTSDYYWKSLQGDETWSNNFHNCTIGGAEIAQKHFENIILDSLNKYRSNLYNEQIPKLGKTANFERQVHYKACIESLLEIQNKLK